MDVTEHLAPTDRTLEELEHRRAIPLDHFCRGHHRSRGRRRQAGRQRPRHVGHGGGRNPGWSRGRSIVRMIGQKARQLISSDVLFTSFVQSC